MTQRTTITTFLALALMTPAGVLAQGHGSGHDGKAPEQPTVTTQVGVHREADDRKNDEITETPEATDVDEPAEATEVQHFEISGPVADVSTTSLDANGQLMTLTAATKIHGELAVGRSVHVEGTVASDGTLTAVNVNVLPAQSHGLPRARFHENSVDEILEPAVTASATGHEQATVHAGPAAQQHVEHQLNRLTAILDRIQAFLAAHFHV